MLLSGPGLLAAALLVSGAAHADPAASRDALDRLEELLQLRLDDGRLSADDVLPAIVVSARPRYEASADWYTTGALEVLLHAFGDGGLRLCEACMAPRATVQDGVMAWQAGPIALDEVLRLDEQYRGDAAPARTAIWLDEQPGGVSVRIVDLRNARVVYAQNVDPNLVENDNTWRMYTLSEELERRARGDSITQAFVDFALYPGQHIALDWTDQWGATNRNLSGVTFTLFDPVVGIGANHYRCLQAFDILVGGQLVLSLPTAVVRAVGDTNANVIDPLVTAVGVMRVPFGRSNYGAVVTASTNGEIGMGISLMNISLVPVIP